MKIDDLKLTKAEKATLKKFSTQTKNALEQLLKITNDKSPLFKLRQAGFKDSCLVKAGKQHGGSKNLEALHSLLTKTVDGTTQLQALMTQGFDADSITKIISKNGGSKNLAALQSLLTKTADGTTQLQALMTQGFDADSIIKIISHGGGSKNLEALQSLLTKTADGTTQLQALMTQGFNADSITRIVGNIGGSKNLAALQSLLTQTADGSTQLQVLMTQGFDADSITKIISHGGGSKNLEALQSLLTQTANRTTQLQALMTQGFDADSITKIISKNGGSKNLEALQSLLTKTADGTTQLQALMTQGFNADSITRIVGNIGGSKNLAALQSLLTQTADGSTQLQVLMTQGFDADSITKIISHGGGSKNLEALQSLLTQTANRTTQLQALMTQGFDADSITKIISKNGGSKNLAALHSLLTKTAGGTTQLQLLMTQGFDVDSITKIVGNDGGSKNLAALHSLLATFKSISGFTLNTEHIQLLTTLSTGASRSAAIAFIEKHIQNRAFQDYILSKIQHFSAFISYSTKQKASHLVKLLSIQKLQEICNKQPKALLAGTKKRKATAVTSSAPEKKKVKQEPKKLYPVSLTIILEIIKRLRTTKKGAISQAMQNCATVLTDLKNGLSHYRQTGRVLDKHSSPAPSMPEYAPIEVQNGQTIALAGNNGQHLYDTAMFMDNMINESNNDELVEELTQTDRIIKQTMSTEQLKRLYACDESDVTRLHEISYWYDESKTIGHVFGGISRNSEIYFFEPQMTDIAKSPFVEIDQYSEYRLHTMILDQWHQDEPIANDNREHRAKRIKQEA